MNRQALAAYIYNEKARRRHNLLKGGGALPGPIEILGDTLVAWMDAQDTSDWTFNSGRVASAPSKAGSAVGLSLDQVTAAYQPTYMTAPDGKPVVRWGGLNALVSSQAWAFAWAMFVSQYDNGERATFVYFPCLFYGDINNRIYGNANGATVTGGGVSSLSKNGVAVGAVLPLPRSVLTFSKTVLSLAYVIGNQASGGNMSWGGDICEIVAASAVPTSEQQLALRQYAYAKWAIEGGV